MREHILGAPWEIVEVTNLFAYIECLHATSASYEATSHPPPKVVPHLLRSSIVENSLALHLVSGSPKLEIVCLFGRFIRRLRAVALQIKTQRKPQLVASQSASQSPKFRTTISNFDNPIRSSIAETIACPVVWLCVEAAFCCIIDCKSFVFPIASNLVQPLGLPLRHTLSEGVVGQCWRNTPPS